MSRLVALVVSLSALVAVAQPEPRVEPKRQRPPVQDHDFTGGQAIQGGRVAPFSEWNVVPEKSRFKNLIRLRASFANELANSVDAL
ncbi:MAG: hypothetical protein SFW67_32510 [Myxococcaceae bacterium]|nr:hypothetical protein [Myxococcaceae bacterium]